MYEVVGYLSLAVRLKHSSFLLVLEQKKLYENKIYILKIIREFKIKWVSFYGFS